MRERPSRTGLLVLCIAWVAIVATSQPQWRRNATASAGVVAFARGAAEVQREFIATVPAFRERPSSGVSVGVRPVDLATNDIASGVEVRVRSFVRDPPTGPGEDTRAVTYNFFRWHHEGAPCVVRLRVTLRRAQGLDAPRAVRLDVDAALRGHGSDAPAGASIALVAAP